MSKQAQVAPFDAADYLDSEETIAEFLAIAAEDETPGVFMRAVEAVAKARGMAQVAEASGLSRESLYKALAPDAQPRFDTVRRVLGALGVGLAVVSLQSRASGRVVRARGAVQSKTSRGVERVSGPRPSSSAPPRTKAATARRETRRR